MTERLEEIKELLDHVGNEANLLHQAKLKREVINMFKEQAELVEELEEHTKTLESDLNKEVQHNNYLHKKNRRYKQALEDIRNNAREDFFKTDILIIATEALEANE